MKKKRVNRSSVRCHNQLATERLHETCKSKLNLCKNNSTRQSDGRPRQNQQIQYTHTTREMEVHQKQTGKKLTIPHRRQIVCSKYFFRPGQRIIQIYIYITETFFQRTINTEIKQSKGCKIIANFCLKCTNIRLAAGLHPDPLGSICASRNP